ncbi:MAG TPA: prolyl aminopeptidase, partial [Streptomyces sp.]|nr:prolyl aminopeptidase [Streptomyces sp.]
DPDPRVRAKATADWCAWEDAVLSLEPNGSANPYGDRPPAARVALVRIVSHYFAHGVWLEEGEILRDAGALAEIPGVLLHGRHDLSSPHGTAWELARAWPGAELVVVEDAGHKGSSAMRDLELAALARFAGR